MQTFFNVFRPPPPPHPFVQTDSSQSVLLNILKNNVPEPASNFRIAKLTELNTRKKREKLKQD
jgi:hypothetical protein